MDLVLHFIMVLGSSRDYGGAVVIGKGEGGFISERLKIVTSVYQNSKSVNPEIKP